MAVGIVEGNVQARWILGPTFSPVLVAANTTAEQTFTLPGLRLTDIIDNVVKPTAQAGLGIVGYRVSAVDTLAVTFSNNTGAGITPTASEVYKVVVVRPDGVTLPTSLPR